MMLAVVMIALLAGLIVLLFLPPVSDAPARVLSVESGAVSHPLPPPAARAVGPGGAGHVMIVVAALPGATAIPIVLLAGERGEGGGGGQHAGPAAVLDGGQRRALGGGGCPGEVMADRADTAQGG